MQSIRTLVKNNPVAVLSLILLSSNGLLSRAESVDFGVRTMQLDPQADTPQKTFILRDNSKVFLRFPETWRYSGQTQELTLWPDRPEANVRIQQIGNRAERFDAARVAQLCQEITSDLPKGSTLSGEVAMKSDPLPIFNWMSFEAGCDYNYYGRVIRKNVLWLNISQSCVLRITTVAAKADFPNIEEQTRRVLSSWFEPMKDLPESLAKDFGTRSGGT